MNVSTNGVGPVQRLPMTWKGQTVHLAYEELGDGPPLLLLPAISTISTRAEMRPLAERLSGSYRCTLVDWPGFGDSDRPSMRYRPPLYLHCLETVATHLFETPPPVVAAGHAATYVLHLGAQRSIEWPQAVLAAPTWRGPLPTVMGDRPGLLRLIEELVRLPLIGPLLYRLNTTKANLQSTAEDHVYADPANVTDAWVEKKFSLTQHPNARYGTAAFLTGGLDVHPDREAFLFDAREMAAPVLALIGEQTPERSRAEMDALAALDNIEHEFVTGSLGLHEELPDAVADHVRRFLPATST